MCWFCNSTSKPKKRIAEIDINVYKIFHIDSITGKISSPIRSTCTWEIGVTKALNSEITPKYITRLSIVRRWEIDEGFHSLRNYPVLLSSSWYTSDGGTYLFENIQDEVVLECIIPRGSTYYINESGCIVSNKLYINS